MLKTFYFCRENYEKENVFAGFFVKFTAEIKCFGARAVASFP